MNGQEYERITNFHTDIVVEESGDFVVTETIRIYSSGAQFQRGIVRRLLLTRIKDSLGRVFRPNYDIISVSRDGEKSNYKKVREGNYLSIYVGDENILLEPGFYEYEIEYRAENQVRFYPKYDELYWNVNGTDWAFTMEKVTASVTLPVQAELIQHACYTGTSGSTERACTFEETASKRFTFSADHSLGPYENLTIAIGFSKDVIPPPPPPGFFQKTGAKLITLLTFGILLFYYCFTWLNFGIDPKKPTTIPLFEQPENLSPASIGMIKKGFYWNDLITASMINLAVKGFIEIVEDKKEYLFGLFKDKTYIINKLNEPVSELPAEEQVIMKKFFRNKDQVILDGKYDSQIGSAVDSFKYSIKKQWNKLIWKGMNAKFWIFPILAAFAYFIFFILMNEYFLDANKWFYFGGFLFTNAILFLIYQWLIRQPSLEKLRLRSLIEGFQMYLTAAEEKQLQHFNPPEMTPDRFEKFLPYAIALDSEKIWGDKFQNFIDQSITTDKSYHPNWYSGGNISNFGSFSQVLNSTLSNTTQHTATQPSSSGSGSSGGGSSGGGGGGGGGGGW